MGLAHRSTLTGHCTSKWLVYLCSCTRLHGRNTVSKVRARSTTFGWSRSSLPNREMVFCWQPELLLLRNPTGPDTGTDTGALTGLHSDSSRAQTGRNGLLGLPGNSFQAMIIPGKTVCSRYRIGVPGWAPISKACLERAVTALLEINVIMPQHIRSK